MDLKIKDLGLPSLQRNNFGEDVPMTKVGASAAIVGVGFFDSDHGQTGVAPNAIEIHPILSITFS